MLDFVTVTERLNKIKRMGYVKIHRTGNTGIGKTLEDLFGIDENNIAGPDAENLELKSARKGAESMLTLFTKSPLPKNANSLILRTFGYPSDKNGKKKELHTTVNAVEYNTLKGKVGFKIGLRNDRIELVMENGQVLGYWDNKTLQDKFEKKFPRLLYVKADSRGRGKNEEFWFDEAWLLSDFSFKNFLRLLKEGTVLVDIRIGQYPDGRTHDHGTGFRVSPRRLERCFHTRERII